MLPCYIIIIYKMTLKLMIFFCSHSTYRFLIFVTWSKEIHERTATENFKPELLAFQFQIGRTCKWFQCITHHRSNFPVSLFFMQNRSIIILCHALIGNYTLWLSVMAASLIIDEAEPITVSFELLLSFLLKAYWIFSVFKLCCHRGILAWFINDDNSSRRNPRDP